MEATLLFCSVGEEEKVFKAFLKKLISSLQKTVALLTFLRKLLKELNEIRNLIIRAVPFVNGVNVVFSHLLHMALLKLDRIHNEVLHILFHCLLEQNYFFLARSSLYI